MMFYKKFDHIWPTEFRDTCIFLSKWEQVTMDAEPSPFFSFESSVQVKKVEFDKAIIQQLMSCVGLHAELEGTLSQILNLEWQCQSDLTLILLLYYNTRNQKVIKCTVNVLKFRTLFPFYSQIKCWFSVLGFTRCLSEKQTGKVPRKMVQTQIRLLLKKQSDQGLHHFSMHFWKATCVRNFRKFTVTNS